MKILEDGIVYRNPKPYLRSRQAFHPTLIDLGNNELLCCYDVAEAIESLDYATYRSRSFDGGRSWTEEGPLLSEPIAERPTTHSIRVAKVGDELIGFGCCGYRDDPEEGILNRENLGYGEMDLLITRSQDGGHSWSAPDLIDTPLPGPFETCSPVVPLPSGRLLAPTACWRGWNGDLPNGQKTIVLISDDNGRTWPSFGVAFDGTEEGAIHWEQSVVPLGDNQLVSLSWVYHEASGQHRPNRFAVSSDGGETFGPAAEIGVDGQTCKGLHLSDGRLLLAYRRNDQPGLWAALTDFDAVGGRWSINEQTQLWGANMRSSGMSGTGNQSDELSGLKFGFPQSRQLADGNVLLVHWCLEEETTHIRWVRLEV